MIKEWKQWKLYAMLVLTAGLISFLGYGVWLGNTNTRIFHLENESDKMENQLAAVGSSQNLIQAELAGIRVELKNILIRLEELRIR